MPMYEVVLIGGSGEEVRLHDRRLFVGDKVKIRGVEWLVERAERPVRRDAERRYICRRPPTVPRPG